ncbi:hypothetical protein CYMTET_8965 [Cymbomonas tetramitiformis]|uniref:HECT domain-containing protein n=1 Tax=Cymbomonas tetramitiformis TaxID=36881 RepID=A0AAE0GSE6_9CHLO|nr:hypothetical protein CYMTET_8965 [Cymbomonas tetramitiformis]
MPPASSSRLHESPLFVAPEPADLAHTGSSTSSRAPTMVPGTTSASASTLTLLGSSPLLATPSVNSSVSPSGSAGSALNLPTAVDSGSGREAAGGSTGSAASSFSAQDTHLPVAHTCYFSLELPMYSSEEVLRQKLLYAIQEGVAIDTDHQVWDTRAWDEAASDDDDAF